MVRPVKVDLGSSSIDPDEIVDVFPLLKNGVMSFQPAMAVRLPEGYLCFLFVGAFF